MIPLRNLLKNNAVCLSLATLWLAACTPIPAVTALPIASLAVERDTSAPTITHTQLPTATATPRPTPTATLTLTAKPTLTPTPDIWEIQKCRKAPSVMEPSDSVLIWTYIGDIEGRGEVDMLLNFTKNNEILGFAFDFERIREYKVRGCVKDRTFTMWLQQGDTVEGVIRGEFPETDPRGYYSSTKALSFSVITGSLMERGNSKSLSIYLHVFSGHGGAMDHRFRIANVEDDAVILNASQQFLAAIARDDRAQVVEMLRFPIETWFRGEGKTFQTPESFLASYNAVFGDGFKERLEITFPNYILAYSGNFGGIYLSVYGGGSIGFDWQGKVTAINNWEKPTPTPTAPPGGSQ